MPNLFDDIDEYFNSYLDNGVFCRYFRNQLKKNPLPAILDEIKYLEGLSQSISTKKEELFRGGELRGLWKKHYSGSSVKNMAINIQNILKLKSKNSRKFEQLALDLTKKNDDDILGYSKLLAEQVLEEYNKNKKTEN